MFRVERAERRRRGLRRTHVPLQPFREAFERSGLSISQFALRMGYVRAKPNVDQARRALGLRPDSHGGRGKAARPREFTSYETAKRLCDALELDYVDMDI